jgi:peptidyl-Lys metalloendopeptidase
MISAAVVALLAGCPAVFATPSVSVSFAGENTVTDVDNFKVVAKVTNSGDETLTLLDDPRTLLAPDWNTETFHITNSEGVVPEFKGVVVSGRDTRSNPCRKFIHHTIPGQVVSRCCGRVQVLHGHRAWSHRGV